MDCIGCNISGRIPDNKLTGATLDGANLEGANLQGVSFGNGESYGNDIANLIGTNLKGANLQGAIWNMYNFQGQTSKGQTLKV